MKINLTIDKSGGGEDPHPGQSCEEAHPGEPCSACAGHLEEGIEMIQDPIGGTIRPDQMKVLIVDDLKQCLYFVENDQWEFHSLLRNVAMRVKVLSDFHDNFHERSEMEV